MSATVKGDKAFAANLKKLGHAADAAVSDALLEIGHEIMRVSQRQAPIDHGDLRRSSYVSRSATVGGHPSVELGYRTEYAVHVHERMDLQHKSPTKAQYLRDPINDATTTFAAKLARKVARWLSSQGTK